MAAGVQDLPEGARGPMLLTQPADLGRTVEPLIFSVVLGQLGQDPAEFWTPARHLAPVTRHPDLSAEGTALHSSNYSYYEYSIVMTIITLEAVLASWPRGQTLCQADRHTFASRPLASDTPSLTSVSPLQKGMRLSRGVSSCGLPPGVGLLRVESWPGWWGPSCGHRKGGPGTLPRGEA